MANSGGQPLNYQGNKDPDLVAQMERPYTVTGRSIETPGWIPHTICGKNIYKKRPFWPSTHLVGHVRRPRHPACRCGGSPPRCQLTDDGLKPLKAPTMKPINGSIRGYGLRGINSEVWITLPAKYCVKDTPNMMQKLDQSKNDPKPERMGHKLYLNNGMWNCFLSLDHMEAYGSLRSISRHNLSQRQGPHTSKP